MSSKPEQLLDSQMRALKIQKCVMEYRFAAVHVVMGPGVRERLDAAKLKDWRFDFAWPSLKFAVEVEGGAWTGGRHTRGMGFSEDLLKYQAAMLLGWTVYRCDPAMVRSGQAVGVIERMLTMCKEQA